MVKVIGSIDNALIWNTTYHLVFSDSELLKFKVMEGAERFLDIYDTQMSNSSRMIPVEGEISNYRVTREEVKNILKENEMRGSDIEKNLDKILDDSPGYLERIPYTSIRAAELSNGNSLSLPHLELKIEGGHMKFHLNHSNYQGHGKLPEEIFSNYENTLKQALGDKLKVKGE